MFKKGLKWTDKKDLHGFYPFQVQGETLVPAALIARFPARLTDHLIVQVQAGYDVAWHSHVRISLIWYRNNMREKLLLPTLTKLSITSTTNNKKISHTRKLRRYAIFTCELNQIQTNPLFSRRCWGSTEGCNWLKGYGGILTMFCCVLSRKWSPFGDKKCAIFDNSAKERFHECYARQREYSEKAWVLSIPPAPKVEMLPRLQMKLKSGLGGILYNE